MTLKYFQKILQIFFFTSLTFSTIFGQSGTLAGKVEENDYPIPAVNIFFMEKQFGGITDNNGNYKIQNIPSGEYEVRFSAVGYKTRFFDVLIQPNKTTQLDVELEQEVIIVGEVEVIGSRIQEQSDTRTSVLELTPRSAKILPGAGEDVFRSLQALPGVLAPNDFSSQLVVRGSGPDQNLIIIDGVEIFNPYRLYGVISMFNPDAVDGVTLVTGGFSAQYGDRLSAVLDVTNREGKNEKFFSGNVNASIIDANLIFEGRNPFNIPGSWLLSSRRTYYDLIIEPFVKNAGLVEDNVSFPNFYDVQTKLTFGPFHGHKFSLMGIYSEDGVDVVSGEERKTADSISVDNTTVNAVYSAAWRYAPTRNFFSKLTFSYYKNSGLTDFDSQVLDPSLNRDRFEEVIPDTLSPYLLAFKFNSAFTFEKYTLDENFSYNYGNNFFDAGFGVDFLKTIIDFRFELDPELRAIFSSNPNFRSAISNLAEESNTKRIKGFVQNRFTFGKNIFLSAGLRIDHYELLNKTYFAPRLALSFALNDLTTLRFSTGLYYQSPGYEKLRDQNVLLDLNSKYTYNIDAEKSAHYIFGIDRWLTNEWNLKIETYYKDFQRLIVPQINQGALYTTELIPGRDPLLKSSWARPTYFFSDSVTQIPVDNSYGESYGFEFLLAKQNRERGAKLNGWISYSLAWANRYEKGAIIPFQFDQRHTVNLVMTYKISERWDLGIRWQFGSGFPYTKPIGVKPRIVLLDLDNDSKPETPEIATRRTVSNPNSEEVIFDIEYGNRSRYNARKPVYHRLDLRGTYFTQIWGLNWSFYLDIINVYNRMNVVGYDYYITDELQLASEANNMFPILPTFGISVKF